MVLLALNVSLSDCNVSEQSKDKLMIRTSMFMIQSKHVAYLMSCRIDSKFPRIFVVIYPSDEKSMSPSRIVPSRGH
jgi:hypothetical protein